MKRSLTSVLVLAALVGFTHFNCATRWREASTGRSADEVGQMLKSLNTTSSGTNATVAEAIKLVEDHPDDVIVYFSEAPGAMGPIEAVSPINFSFVNKDIGLGSVTSIRVFFIDLLSDNGNLNYLLVDYVVSGQSGHQVISHGELMM